MSSVSYLFPTPVFCTIASPYLQLQIEEEFKAKEEDIKKYLGRETWGDNTSSTWPSIGNILTQKNLDVLKQHIDDCCKEFLKEISEPACVLRESWVNYNQKYQFQNRHVHLPARISGIYYLKTTGVDGNLALHPPSDIMNGTTKEIIPETGLTVLFHSWTPHSVRQNLTDSTRISVAFNYY
jgi:hypothetical protein